MQMQDYLPYFQELLLQYYQFTLENSVYAACLAIAVWLLTAIFYSLRIGFLNRRNTINLKAVSDAENAAAAAQQEIQKLQVEVAAGKEQLEQETQRAAALQERLAALSGQLSESIVAMAAQPDLGQQGLSVAPGLEVEHLWQRFSAAVQQVGESLIAQRRANNELQRIFDAEKANLAEKDSQLQATQTRLDSQRQQLAKLEQTLEEQKTQLAQQQENAERRLAEVEAKYRADLARLSTSGQVVRETISAAPQPAPQEKPKVPVTQPEPNEPAEIKVEAPKSSQEPKPAPVEAKPVVVEAAVQAAVPAPTIARVEEIQQKQRQAKEKTETGAGVGGKFKSWFSGAKQQMEKLDDMFGLNTPMLAQEESTESVRPQSLPVESVIAEAPVKAPEIKPVVAQPDNATRPSSEGLGGKFKNLFASSKPAPVVEQPEELVVEAPQPVETSQVDAGKAEGKLKSLFGKLKKGA